MRDMEGKSLRVYNTERTFFSKITNTITKLLIPTKVGINGMLISIKRNSLLKAYENFALSSNLEEEKKEALSKKYEDIPCPTRIENDVDINEIA